MNFFIDILGNIAFIDINLFENIVNNIYEGIFLYLVIYILIYIAFVKLLLNDLAVKIIFNILFFTWVIVRPLVVLYFIFK